MTESEPINSIDIYLEYLEREGIIPSLQKVAEMIAGLKGSQLEMTVKVIASAYKQVQGQTDTELLFEKETFRKFITLLSQDEIATLLPLLFRSTQIRKKRVVFETELFCDLLEHITPLEQDIIIYFLLKTVNSKRDSIGTEIKTVILQMNANLRAKGMYKDKNEFNDAIIFLQRCGICRKIYDSEKELLLFTNEVKIDALEDLYFPHLFENLTMLEKRIVYVLSLQIDAFVKLEYIEIISKVENVSKDEVHDAVWWSTILYKLSQLNMVNIHVPPESQNTTYSVNFRWKAFVRKQEEFKQWRQLVTSDEVAVE